MILLTNKLDNLVIGIGISFRTENNYLILKTENEKEVMFLIENINIFEDIDIPEEVVVGTWCYTKQRGFYKAGGGIIPTELDPYKLVSEDILNKILEKYTLDLITGGIIHG